MKYLKTLVIISSLLLLFYSCKKQSGGYSISYSGSKYLGGTINFKSNAPYSANVLWDFGDGTTSALATPSHVYQNGGLYNVSLIVGVDSVKCAVGIGVDSSALANFCLSHNWIHTTTQITAGYPDTTYYDSNKTFAITMLNPAILILLGDTVYLDGATNTDTILTYEHTYFPTWGGPDENYQYQLKLSLPHNSMTFVSRSTAPPYMKPTTLSVPISLC